MTDAVILWKFSVDARICKPTPRRHTPCQDTTTEGEHDEAVDHGIRPAMLSGQPRFNSQKPGSPFEGRLVLMQHEGQDDGQHYIRDHLRYGH